MTTEKKRAEMFWAKVAEGAPQSVHVSAGRYRVAVFYPSGVSYYPGRFSVDVDCEQTDVHVQIMVNNLSQYSAILELSGEVVLTVNNYYGLPEIVAGRICFDRLEDHAG